MSLVIDPVWPWSHLWAFLSAASPSVVFAVVMLGVLAFALPVALARRAFGMGARQLLSGAGLALVLLGGMVVLGVWGQSGMPGPVQALGLATLLMAPLALMGVTVAAYVGAAGTTRGRVGAVLTFRLAAFGLALVAIVRPSLATADRSRSQSLLLIALDRSGSMSIHDEFNNQSRWELLLKTLRESEPVLQRLRDEQQVEVALHGFADGVSEFRPDEPGEADGKSTDFGGLLRRLYEGRDGRRPPRRLLILSDGADNGTRTPALAEAARWRHLPCPIETFGGGRTTTSDTQNDIAVRTIATEPSPVLAKGKMTVKVAIDARGFENSTVRVRLFLDDKEVLARDEVLPLSEGNELRLYCTAPAKSEVKVTVRVEDPQREGKAPPGDLIAANNVIETIVPVSKEGVSVLLVDKRRFWEPKFLREALGQDSRIRVTQVWLGGGPAGGAGDLFQFAERQYDVVILGDVTAAQVEAVSPGALATIEKLVGRGAGLLMLGGYASFGNSDWQGTEIEKVLPVDLTRSRGQVNRATRVLPTEPGLRKYGYLLRVADDRDVRKVWEDLPELEGINVLVPSKKGLESVLAESQDREPILVTQTYGEGRVLAFGGDTTHRWVRDVKGKQVHSRFWRQMVLWLAKQENAQGSVWVKPDVGRVAVHSDLNFRVGVRSKGGVDLKDGNYKVTVTGPAGAREVPVTHGQGDDHGVFTRTDAPGEYHITVEGAAKGPDGETVKGTASARFLVYEEDVEQARRAADHEFLKKLAAAGGGEFHRVEELPQFLEKLRSEPLTRERPKLDLRPDWRTTARSPFLAGFFVAFVALLTGEWALRRRWGMV